MRDEKRLLDLFSPGDSNWKAWMTPQSVKAQQIMGKLACYSEYTQYSTGGSLGTRLPGIQLQMAAYR